MNAPVLMLSVIRPASIGVKRMPRIDGTLCCTPSALACMTCCAGRISSAAMAVRSSSFCCQRHRSTVLDESPRRCGERLRSAASSGLAAR